MPALSDIFAPQRFYPGMSPDFMPDYGGVSGETPTQYDALGEVSYGMTNVGGLQDAAGYSGGPSIRENVDQGNYGSAALQAAGTLPVVGGLAATLGKAALGGAALYKAAKGVSKAEMDPSLLRVLVGPNAKGFNHADAAKARDMVAERPERDAYITEGLTGTMDFGDNVQFQEFADNEMRFVNDPQSLPLNQPVPVSSLVDWPSLSQNYPDLTNDLKIVKYNDNQAGVRGFYNPGQRLIGFNNLELLDKAKSGTPELYRRGLLSTIAHEGQHAVSNLEGAAAGGNDDVVALLRQKMSEKGLSPEDLASVFAMPGVPAETTIQSLKNIQNAPNAFSGYQALLDEARARTTAGRRAMTQKQTLYNRYVPTMDIETPPSKRIILPQDWMERAKGL